MCVRANRPLLSCTHVSLPFTCAPSGEREPGHREVNSTKASLAFMQSLNSDTSANLPPACATRSPSYLHTTEIFTRCSGPNSRSTSLFILLRRAHLVRPVLRRQLCFLGFFDQFVSSSLVLCLKSSSPPWSLIFDFFAQFWQKQVIGPTTRGPGVKTQSDQI